MTETAHGMRIRHRLEFVRKYQKSSRSSKEAFHLSFLYFISDHFQVLFVAGSFVLDQSGVCCCVQSSWEPWRSMSVSAFSITFESQHLHIFFHTWNTSWLCLLLVVKGNNLLVIDRFGQNTRQCRPTCCCGHFLAKTRSLTTILFTILLRKDQKSCPSKVGSRLLSSWVRNGLGRLVIVSLPFLWEFWIRCFKRLLWNE